MTMKARDVAMTAAGSAAVGSAMASATLIWLLLTRPVDLAGTVGSHDLGGLVRLAAETLYDLVLHFLGLL
jgi:hypothetical protein